MKKFLMAILIIVTISTAAFGATSNDVYLRQDVFEAKMDAFMAEIRLMNEQTKAELRKEIQETKTELSEKIQGTKAELTEKIDGTKAELTEKIQDTNSRIDTTNSRIDATNARLDVTDAKLDSLITMVYWGIAFLSIIVAVAAVAPFIVQALKNSSQPKFTLEDVERLIDAKLQNKGV